MDGIGKIDHRGSGREINNVPLGREDKDLLRDQIALDCADNIFHILRVALALQKLADPRQALLELVILAGDTQLIFPVGGNPVLGRVVHLPRADLHFKGDALLADDGSVQGLVHIGLGGGDIILKAPGDRFIHIVDNTQAVITVDHRIHNDPHGKNVIDLIKVMILHVHLAVDAVHALDAALDMGALDGLENAARDALLNLLKIFAVGLPHIPQRLLNIPIADRVQIADGTVLQLLLEGADTEPVRDGRVDLERLKCRIALLLRLFVFQSAHVVQAVGQLDNNDADILRHGQQHFADILRLNLLLGGERDLAELGDAVDDHGDLIAEFLLDLVVGDIRILYDVMQQRRHD